MMNKAIFFDKDNTLIKDKVYNCDFEKIELFDDTINSLKFLSNTKYMIFIVSNQSAIGRNYFTKDYYLEQLKLLIEYFYKNGVFITDHIFCPHVPEDYCLCRKPEVGMIKRLQAYYNLDLSNSYFIGDRYTDIEMAIKCGIIPIFIKRGYPEGNGKIEGLRNDSKKLYILPQNLTNKKIMVIQNLFELKKLIKF